MVQNCVLEVQVLQKLHFLVQLDCTSHKLGHISMPETSVLIFDHPKAKATIRNLQKKVDGTQLLHTKLEKVRK